MIDEIQQLRMQLADHGELVSRLEAEIERLKIENNERVMKLLAQIVAMRAGIERLNDTRGEQDLEINKLRGQLEAVLAAEIKRREPKPMKSGRGLADE